jgi:CRISPR-associated protein Csb3
MSSLKPTIAIPVDLTNPGQFLACCGLLELADRIWPGTEGLFERGTFFLLSTKDMTEVGSAGLFDSLAQCTLTNTMTTQQISRLAELSAMKGSVREKDRGLDEEKKSLEKLRREEPILLQAPFHLRLDWFQDVSAGGSRFKTWAGQQSVLDIASSMKKAIEVPDWRARTPDEWFSKAVSGCGLPFNFDSDLGGQGSALDVGFSFDPLAASATTRIESSARPCLELLAFVGLQRFRPRQLMNYNRYLYCTWNQPLPPELAAPAACGMLPLTGAPLFEFRLLYRTKYLKSFLPAIPYFGGSNE